MWEIMSSEGSIQGLLPRDAYDRINLWTQDVEQGHSEAVELGEVITTEPSRRMPPMIPTAVRRHSQRQSMNRSRSAQCYQAWIKETCPTICGCMCSHVISAPIRVPVCIADCIGRCCFVYCFGQTSESPGCCTICCFTHFPLCMPEICMTENASRGMGAECGHTIAPCGFDVQAWGFDFDHIVPIVCFPVSLVSCCMDSYQVGCRMHNSYLNAGGQNT